MTAATAPAATWQSDLTGDVTFEVVLLTPELAAEFLEALPERQRRMSMRTVDRYCADILAGQFPFTGDPIRFNLDGELIDGQHRCQAVLETSEAVPVLVIRNLGADLIRFFDSGRTRRFPDDLRIAGYANHLNLAALTARVWHWEHGNYGYMEYPYVANPVYSNTTPTRAMLWKTLQDHPELPEVVTHGGRISRYVPNAPASVVALAWWLLGKADIDAREKFFHELVNGSAQGGPEYPITVLHRLMTRRMGTTEHRPGPIWLAYIIKAYNAWLEGRTISYLRMPSPVTWSALPMPQGLERPGVQARDGDG